MRLRHSYDRQYDLATQMEQLSRDTTEMLLETLGSIPLVTDDTPASNSTECTPTVATRSWHYTAMSAATFALSAFLGYIATEAIWKRVRSHN